MDLLVGKQVTIAEKGGVAPSSYVESPTQQNKEHGIDQSHEGVPNKILRGNYFSF